MFRSAFIKIVELIVLFGALSLLAGVLYPFLGDEILAGWDLTPQYYLYDLALKNLRDGRITSYDPLWFSGYPAFQFYGIVPFFLPALSEIYLVSALREFFHIDKTHYLTFNLFILSLPLLFIVSFYYATNRWTGCRSYALAVVFALIFLTTSGDPHMAPLGIYYGLFHGHISAFWSLSLFMFALGVIARLEEKEDLLSVFMLGVLTAILFLSHAITSIALFFVYLVFFLFSKIRWHLVAAGILALIFTCWWWVPFLKYFDFTSGREQWRFFTGPLSAILSDQSLLTSCEIFSTGFFLRFPLPAILLFVGAVIGSLRLIERRKIALPLLVVLLLLFLSDRLFEGWFTIPLHYSRLYQPLYGLFLLLSFVGIYEIYRDETNDSFKKRYSGLQKTVVTLLLCWSFLITLTRGNPYTLPQSLSTALLSDENGCKRSLELPQLSSFSEKPWYGDANRIIHSVKKLSSPKRIAIESSVALNKNIGSIHYFSTFLPLEGVEVLPGLLAESAYSAQFVNSLLTSESKALKWAKITPLEFDKDLEKSEKALELFRRYSLYGVTHVIATSKEYRTLLGSISEESTERFQEIERFGDISLFELSPSPARGVEITGYKPVLFIDNGGISFDELTTLWWNYSERFDAPVITTEKEFSHLTKEERAQFGGVIVSVSPERSISEVTSSYLGELNLPLMILKDKPVVKDEAISGKLLVLHPYEWVYYFEDFFLKDEDESEITHKPVPYKFIDNHRIKIQSEGMTLLRYSYFPRWHLRDSDRTVFLAMPSSIAFFYSGESELEFR